MTSWDPYQPTKCCVSSHSSTVPRRWFIYGAALWLLLGNPAACLASVCAYVIRLSFAHALPPLLTPRAAALRATWPRL